MSRTIQLRQENPDESENMASLDSVDGDVYGYVARQVADQLGEYFEVELSEDADVTASLDGVTGSGSGNYATFETAGGNVVGFGISLDVIEDVFDMEIERDSDDIVQNAPESIGMTFAPSTEEAFEEAEEADEEEADALLAGVGDDDSVEVEEEEETIDELVADAQD